MNIDTEKAFKYFEKLIHMPVLGKALYCQVLHFMDLVSANIEQFKDIQALREKVKKTAANFPKKPNYIEFEIIKVNEMWLPVIPGNQDCEPRKIIPGKLVDFIVKKSFDLGDNFIYRKHDLKIPGLKSKTFDLWFQKIQDDYIQGVIKSTINKNELGIGSAFSFNHNIDIEQEIKDLKAIDLDEIFAVFKYTIEIPHFRMQILREYRKIWKPLFESQMD